MHDWKKCYIFAIEIKTYYKMKTNSPNSPKTLYIIQREHDFYRNNRLIDSFEEIEAICYETMEEAESGIERLQNEVVQHNPDATIPSKRRVVTENDIYRWRIVPVFLA